MGSVRYRDGEGGAGVSAPPLRPPPPDEDERGGGGGWGGFPGLWILVERVPVPCPHQRCWAQWYEVDEHRRVGKTTIGRLTVYTSFLAIGLGYANEPPLLFETMIAADADGPGLRKWGHLQIRCSTWLEAEAQHAAVVSAVHRETYPERYELGS